MRVPAPPSRAVRCNTALTSILMAALAGCGGGGDDVVAAAPPAAAPVAPGPVQPGGSGLPSGSGSEALAASDFTVNTTRDGRQDGAQVARLADGGFVVAWLHHATAGGTELRMQRFDAQARAVGNETTLTPLAGARSQPGLAALAGGGFVVTWTLSSGVEQQGYAQVFDDGGLPLGPAAAISGNLARFVARPVALPGGGFAVAADARTGQRSADQGTVQRFGAGGAPDGQPVVLPGGSAASHVLGAVAAPWAAGGFAAAWVVSESDGSSSLRLGRFAADGAPAAAPIVVASSPEVPIGSPSLATLGDGTLVVAWVTQDPAPGGASVAPRLWVRRFSPAGAALAAAQEVPSGPADRPFAPVVAATPDGGCVLAWSTTRAASSGMTERTVRVQRFGAGGTAVGAAQVLGQVTAAPIAFGDDQSLGVAGARGSQYLLVRGDFAPATDWDVRGAVR